MLYLICSFLLQKRTRVTRGVAGAPGRPDVVLDGVRDSALVRHPLVLVTITPVLQNSEIASLYGKRRHLGLHGPPRADIELEQEHKHATRRNARTMRTISQRV